MTQLTNALTRLFDRHRIVFWYDVGGELQSDLHALALPEVEILTLDNNEFGVKHRVLRQEPGRKFLIYSPQARPPDRKNWLLDVELAHGIFHADQISMWMTDLGLPSELRGVVADHRAFFEAASRRERLKNLLSAADGEGQIRLKMVAVCAESEPRLDEIMEALLEELAAGREESQRLLARCGLDAFLWSRAEQTYGYRSASPSVRDFLLALMRTGYDHALGQAASGDQQPLNAEAMLFLRRWKESRRHGNAFATLSAQTARDLDIEEDLQARSYPELLRVDLFRLVDLRILSELVPAVANNTVTSNACEGILRQRRRTHWYPEFENAYLAVNAAAQLLEGIGTADLRIESPAHGVDAYARQWYGLDQAYRQFVFHTDRSGLPTLLDGLAIQIENHYVNSFLLPLNDAWQGQMDRLDRWPPRAANLLVQSSFYEEQIRKPYLTQGKKIYVVISDALRYEVGEELLRRIRQEDRYDAELRPMLTLLPSYTQLGMAALLPHQRLTIHPEDGTVWVDGQSSAGTENRAKILDRGLPGRATAIQADRLLKMTRDESRELARNHHVIYVYQNRIDSVGDKRDSEGRVFDAVAEALDELILILKKLTAANANNMLVTADHGFLYQHRPLAESDFAATAPVGTHIHHQNRRYVFGQGLTPDASFKHFTSAQVGLDGETELLIPKSINRLRQKGTGNRYVHGGASLQEVVIPLLQINKKRTSDLDKVDVDILQTQSSTITTGQATITLYQSRPVSEKVQPRPLRIGFYTQEGVLISDQHTLLFDFESELPREREVVVRLMLSSQADVANNQEVLLRLEEPVDGTTQYRTYRTARYLLRRSFTSDFDGFEL